VRVGTASLCVVWFVIVRGSARWYGRPVPYGTSVLIGRLAEVIIRSVVAASSAHPGQRAVISAPGQGSP
jgi:hypothetical protein